MGVNNLPKVVVRRRALLQPAPELRLRAASCCDPRYEAQQRLVCDGLTPTRDCVFSEDHIGRTAAADMSAKYINPIC